MRAWGYKKGDDTQHGEMDGSTILVFDVEYPFPHILKKRL